MKIIRVVFGAYIKFFVYFWTTNNYSNTILFRTHINTMGDNLTIFRNICIGYNLCKKILSRKKPFFGILCEILQIIAGKLRRFKKITLLLLQACALCLNKNFIYAIATAENLPKICDDSKKIQYMIIKLFHPFFEY